MPLTAEQNEQRRASAPIEGRPIVENRKKDVPPRIR